MLYLFINNKSNLKNRQKHCFSKRRRIMKQDKKYHLFYSAKQAKIYEESGDLDKICYQLEDGQIVEITEVKNLEEGQPTPSSNFDDAVYLGVGTFHHRVPHPKTVRT